MSTVMIDVEDGVVRASGDLDIQSAPMMRSALDRMSQVDGADVVIDMSGVTFMDSTGLTTLMDARLQAERDGWAFTVRRPSSAVRRVFDLAGVGSLLDDG